MLFYRLKSRSQGCNQRMMGTSRLIVLLLLTVASAYHEIAEDIPIWDENYDVTHETSWAFLGLVGQIGVIALVLATLACIACCCFCCLAKRQTRSRGAVHQPAQQSQGGGHLNLQQPGGGHQQQPGGYHPQQPGGYQQVGLLTPQEVGYQHQLAGYNSPPGQEQIAPPGFSGYPSQPQGYPQEPPGYPSQPPPYPGTPEPFPAK